jgi:hypothetical protein
MKNDMQPKNTLLLYHQINVNVKVVEL